VNNIFNRNWRRVFGAKKRPPRYEREDNYWADLNYYSVVDVKRKLLLSAKNLDWVQWLKRFPIWLRKRIRKGVFNPEPELYLAMYEFKRLMGLFPMPDGSYSDAKLAMTPVQRYIRMKTLEELQGIFSAMKEDDKEVEQRFRYGKKRWTENDEENLLRQKKDLIPLLKQVQSLSKEFELPE
jgi:hypothetical protein